VQDYQTLSPHEQQQLADQLRALAAKLGQKPADTATAEQLLRSIDERLGTPDRRRDPGPLREWGPPRRQIQVLCWKHGLDEYNSPRLNPFELLQRLEGKVTQ
jgi:hypothetical protein